MKRCPKCGVEKELEGFHTNPGRSDGVSSYCRPCADLAGKSSYARRRASDPVEMWARFALNGARRRARARGVPFTLTKRDLIAAATETCPVFGIPLNYRGNGNSTHGASRDCASVDRIIPSLGYTPNNIVVVSIRANLMKYDGTSADIYAVADFYAGMEARNG